MPNDSSRLTFIILFGWIFFENSWIFFGLIKMHMLVCCTLQMHMFLEMIISYWPTTTIGLHTIHLFMFMGRDMGETKQCTLDLLNTDKRLQLNMFFIFPPSSSITWKNGLNKVIDYFNMTLWTNHYGWSKNIIYFNLYYCKVLFTWPYFATQRSFTLFYYSILSQNIFEKSFYYCGWGHVLKNKIIQGSPTRGYKCLL